jgi:hypothetical protein
MPSPPIIKYGNDLSAEAVQPGWTIESDGFGLLQSSVTFKWADTTAHRTDFAAHFYRGASHPDPSYSGILKLYRATMTVDKGKFITVKADYCGIASAYTELGHTYPQVQMTSAAASESIQSHPNFININCTSIEGSTSPQKPLAGPPPAAGGFEPSLTINPNRAAWTPKIAGSGIVNNCQFIGFLPNQSSTDTSVNIKAGIRSYYKPQNTLRVLTYYSSVDAALELSSYVGWVTNGTKFALPTEYKKLGKPQNQGGYTGGMNYSATWLASINPNFLVTNCSVELYGTIYKVTADLTLSGLGGWDKDVYPVISGE